MCCPLETAYTHASLTLSFCLIHWSGLQAVDWSTPVPATPCVEEATVTRFDNYYSAKRGAALHN
jgi:hypothetical protein